MSRTLLTVSLLIPIAALSQPAPDRPAFDAAEVRVAKPGSNDRFVYVYAGRAEFRGARMLAILSTAFGVEEERIVGGPKWLDSTRFDISAKSKPSTPDDTIRAMLVALLQDRLKLVTHRDERPMPAYVISVAKRGSKLQPASGEGPPGCDGVPSTTPGLTSVACKSLNAPAIAFNLRQMANAYLNHPVIDETRLKGTYDFNLSWTPRGQLRKPSDPEYDPAKHISVFDAVEKQLGLKIDLQSRPVPVIVIDSLEENPENSETTAKPPAPTEFEVASLRPSRSGATEINGRFLPGGQLEITNMPVKEMIKLAYNVRNDGLAGVPKWADSDRYDLSAKAGSIVPPEILRVMFQNLLAERFGLTLHHEDQPASVYALTGKGAKLKPAAESERPGCKRAPEDGMQTYTCQRTTMAQFAEEMRNLAPAWVGDHPVVDATGLTGSYDFALKWSARGRFLNSAGRGGDASSAAGPTAADPTGDITFFEAVDKQLGLKLSIQKRPMPVLVIDQLNRTPAEN